MHKALLALSLTCAALPALAAAPKDPAQYPLTIHVTGSLVTGYVGHGPTLIVYATVDGEPVQMTMNGYLLTPGDYSARITGNGFRVPAYHVAHDYEFLFPDGKTSAASLSCIGPQCAVGKP